MKIQCPPEETPQLEHRRLLLEKKKNSARDEQTIQNQMRKLVMGRESKFNSKEH